MHIDDIKKALRAEPFRPFIVNLADGRTFAINHPEFLAVPPDGRRTIIVFLPGEEGFEIIDPTLVTSLTIDKKKGNGRKKKAG